jgi:beta-fructofuranosidase
MPPSHTLTELAALRRGQPDDPHRPRYHFTPPANWMNDPNGLIQWQGRYHLFYQYNPLGPFHAKVHWGHAVGDDLVHWEDWPVALAPTPGGPDAEGCWSGCTVDVNGTPTMFYTGFAPQTVCAAMGSGDLREWRKHEGNPLIAVPPPELAEATRGDFRDPFVWREGERWHMVIAVRVEGKGGAVLHYTSGDARHWGYAGVLLHGDKAQMRPFQSGMVWECPNMAAVAGRHVLLVSVISNAGQALYPVYFAGDFDGQQFAPRAEGVLVHGPSLYAPQVMRLGDGRVVLLGWMREERPQAALDSAGWAGAMSIPMTLEPSADGGIHLAPVEELKSLRRTHHRIENLVLEPGSAGLGRLIEGDSLEVEAVFEPEPNAIFGLRLRRSPDGAEQTKLSYDAKAQRLALDPPGVNPAPAGAEREAPVSLDRDGRLHLRIFLDRSVVEIFANVTTCLAGRLYPLRPDSLGLDVFCTAGMARLVRLDVWEMARAEAPI